MAGLRALGGLCRPSENPSLETPPRSPPLTESAQEKVCPGLLPSRSDESYSFLLPSSSAALGICYQYPALFRPA